MSASDTHDSKQTVIVLLGPPGSGKGTLAKELSKVKKVPHISTGDLFYENLKNKTELGLQAQHFLDKGQLVPDSLVLDLLYDRILNSDCEHGYILDGIPRNIAQVHELEDFLRNKGTIIVLNLDVPDDVVLNRLSGRLICENCHHVWHKDIQAPKQPGICDLCGGALLQRSDDTPQAIQERLKVYHEQTKPLEKFYEEQHLLKHLDASKSAEEVLAQAVGVFSSL